MGVIIHHPFVQARRCGVIVADAPPTADALDVQRPPMPWWGAIIWLALIIGMGAICAGFGAFVAVIANTIMAGFF